MARIAALLRFVDNVDFIELFRAELDLSGWSSEMKSDALAITREMMGRGVEPRAVRLTTEGAGPEYADAA